MEPTNFGKILGGFGLLLLLGYAFTWIGALIGLSVRTPEGSTSGGLIDPGLSQSGAWPMQHPVWASLIYSVLIILIFRTLAVRKYRSAAS